VSASKRFSEKKGRVVLPPYRLMGFLFFLGKRREEKKRETTDRLGPPDSSPVRHEKEAAAELWDRGRHIILRTSGKERD